MGKNKQQEGEGNRQTVDVNFQLPLGDWELFRLACTKIDKEPEEAFREIIVNWATDVLKTELLPP